MAETDISEKALSISEETFGSLTKPTAIGTVTEKDGILLSSDGKTFVGITERFTGQTLSIPDGVERVASESLCYTNVSTLIVPDSVSVIEDNAVMFNDALQYVSIQGQAVIGAKAFYHNLSLSAIDAPDVKAIGAFAFGTCLSLRRIEAPRVLYIDTCAFCRCEALTGVTFQSVIEIGEAVFCECLSLTYADMPLLQKIPFRTFDHCVSLLCADYPRVLSVGGLAFSECRCLQSFHMPRVQEIGDRAFAGTALCRFILPSWQANGLFALFAYSYNAVMGGPVPVIYAEATPENVQYAAALHFELRGVSEIADHSVVNDWVTVSGPLYLYDDTVLVAVTDPGTTLLLPRFALSSDTVWSTVLYENRLYQVKTIQLEKTTPCDYLRSRPIDEAEIKPICHDGYYGDFSYEAYDDYIKVTGYHGGSTDVFIPEFIDGKPVTILSQSLLGGVTIPEELFMSHAVTSVTARSVTAFDGGTELDADGAPRQSLFFFTTHWLTSLSFPMLKALPDDCWVGDCHLTVLDLSSCEAIADGCFINCQIDNLFLPAGSIFRQEAFRQCTVGRLTFKQP